MIRIYVIDDHPVVREGLVAVLEDQSDFEVAGSAGSAEEGIEAAKLLAPDVIVLDLELPGMDGVAAIPELARAVPGARIVAFTAYDTDERVFGAVHSGIHGYLLKGASAEEIARAIRIVHGGGSYLESRVAAKVMARGRPGTVELSPREKAVLRLVAEGLANKQIGAALGIAERTVKFHVSSILVKLEADNRAQAVAIAGQRGLL